MKEFFGIGGYTRTPEGYFSWQHITFVTSLLVVMTVLAILIGLRNRKKEQNVKNKVIICSAVLIDVIELFKIVLLCFRHGDPMHWRYELPLFLCSIQLIALPLAAFSKGRLKDAALDFVLIFGILGAIMGTYGAGQNYNAYPVFSFDNAVSGITHSISGFSSLYIAISGMASMKKKNIGITFGILTGFCVAAYIANVTIDYNYMFLMRGDGTPYDIFYNLFSGNKVLYPLSVVILFLAYISLFYLIYFALRKKSSIEEKDPAEAFEEKADSAQREIVQNVK